MPTEVSILGGVGGVTTVLVTKGNGVFKFRTVPNAFSILAKSVSHGVIEILEQKDAPVAHSAEVHVGAQKLRGLAQGEGVAAGSGSPLGQELKESLLFVLGNGNAHGTSVGHIPQLTTDVTNWVREKLVQVRLTGTKGRFVHAQNLLDTSIACERLRRRHTGCHRRTYCNPLARMIHLPEPERRG